MQYDPEFIRHLFDYMVWADRATFAAAQNIPDAEYYKPRDMSAGSIHNLFVHQMVAQNTWLSRWQGKALTGRLENETEHPTRELLGERWPVVHQGLLEFVDRQSAHVLNEVITVRRNNGEPITLPLGGMMMHVADHGSYHRGQLNTMFKQAGAEPAYMPYLWYAREQMEKPS